MKNLLPSLFFALLVGVAHAQPNLPACQGLDISRWNSCFGTFSDRDGDRYVGEWKNGNLNGQGTLTTVRGDKFVGEFKDGKFSGQGSLTAVNGDKFVGQWNDGKLNGHATWFASNGSVSKQGIWADNNFVRSAPVQQATVPSAHPSSAESDRLAAEVEVQLKTRQELDKQLAAAKERETALLQTQQRDRERLEAERLQAERKQNEEQAQIRALASLKIKNVGLGVGPVPCKVTDNKVASDQMKFSCTFGPNNDETEVTFAADRKTVVSVSRWQFLGSSDLDRKDMLKAAVIFYGPPTFVNYNNWIAMYGNPYNTRNRGNVVEVDDNDFGVGMLIRGLFCAEDKWVGGMTKCGSRGTAIVHYHLVNRRAYEQSKLDGKERAVKIKSTNLNKQKF
jgi:hypothetical protein